MSFFLMQLFVSQRTSRDAKQASFSPFSSIKLSKLNLLSRHSFLRVDLLQIEAHSAISLAPRSSQGQIFATQRKQALSLPHSPSPQIHRPAHIHISSAILTSEYLILSSYLYCGPGAFLPMFSFLVSSLTKTLLPSHLLAWEKLNWAAVFSTERGNLPKEVCACSESRAWASAVKSI